jgi:hypothetical protein
MSLNGKIKMPCSNLAIALVHYPVYNKHREIVTTAITNLDIHDISRSCRTYGVGRYYLVTPSSEQQALLGRIINHWDAGWGADYNPDRKEALSIAKGVSTLADAIADLQGSSTEPVRIIATGAKARNSVISFETLRNDLKNSNQPVLILLGTGWGLADEIFEMADGVLEPIQTQSGYNHLSVRSAASIMLDRLLER